MIFCYLLESTELCGGVRVVFDQARGLLKRGHQVLIRAKYGDHHWYHHDLHIDYVSDLAEPLEQGMHTDIVIATFWTTVLPAISLNCARTFHFCQGYEGDFIEYAAIKSEIDAAYCQAITKLTIGDWISERLQVVFGTKQFSIYTIGQIVDIELFNVSSLTIRRIWRYLLPCTVKILLIGTFESRVKGIANALHAIQLLRQQGVKLSLTRVSNLPLNPDENNITHIDSYAYNIAPSAMAYLYHHHDLMMAPSLVQEGFGLPFAEALACGLPCVATRIPSYLSFHENHDYATFVAPANPDAMARAAFTLINDYHQQNKQRQQGIQLVPQLFSENIVIEKLESICLKFFIQ